MIADTPPRSDTRFTPGQPGVKLSPHLPDQGREAEKRLGGEWSGSWSTGVSLACATGLLIALAFPVLRWWFWEYTKPESYYGYALFVPALVGVMVWHDRVKLRAIPMRRSPAALFFLVPLLGLLVLAMKADMEAVMSTAFLLGIVASVWFVAGTRFVRAAAFPLAFLFTMAPLPGPLLNDATLGLQRISTGGAAFLLKILGFAPHQEGNLIRMSNFLMEVDVPCSGFKLLLCLMTFSAAFAYLSDTTRVRQTALFAVALPLSLVLNAVRITLFGIVGECLGASAAHAFHDWSGFIMLALCMVALFGFAKGLGCRKFAGLPLF